MEQDERLEFEAPPAAFLSIYQLFTQERNEP